MKFPYIHHHDELHNNKNCLKHYLFKFFLRKKYQGIKNFYFFIDFFPRTSELKLAACRAVEDEVWQLNYTFPSYYLTLLLFLYFSIFNLYYRFIFSFQIRSYSQFPFAAFSLIRQAECSLNIRYHFGQAIQFSRYKKGIILRFVLPFH